MLCLKNKPLFHISNLSYSLSLPYFHVLFQSWEVADASSNFTSDITPLILAAHKNNYEILKLLLDRGATLPTPHDARYTKDEMYFCNINVFCNNNSLQFILLFLHFKSDKITNNLKFFGAFYVN